MGSGREHPAAGTTDLRVIVVDDSPADVELLAIELARIGRAVAIERVDGEEQLREALARKACDLVIADWSSAKLSALAALAVLAQAGLDMPFIVLSGTGGEEHAGDAMRAGAHDYLVKGQLARLGPAVQRELRAHESRVAKQSTERELSEHRGVSIFSDLTERKLAEERKVAVFDAALDAVLAMDHMGKVTEFNPSAEHMFGYARSEVIGRPLADVIVPPSMRAAHAAGLERYLRTGEAAVLGKRTEITAMRADGSEFSVELSVSRAASTGPPTFVGFVRDLSERRRIDRALAERMAEKVHLEEQLRQSQKMEAVGRLAGGIAHDFNNALSVVLTYSELVTSQLPENDPLRADVEEIMRAGERAAALTRQLLMFSRQQVIQPRVLDLAALLAGMDVMLRRLVGEDIALSVVRGAPAGRVRADLGSMEQVVMNLVVNARDAMPVGGKLTIEVADVTIDEEYAARHLGAKAGPHVMLAVSDTGTGIDPATQARIFEPFFTTKGPGEGTGLGLSTVLGIVQQSGGHVLVYSEAGLGSTFKIYLPRVDVAADAVAVRSNGPLLRGTETILLVEDEPQVRQVAHSILLRMGYTVLEARNGAEALTVSSMHDGPIDLLLTDVVMPGMSGSELAKRLAVSRPSMKVLCMSGYTDEAAIRHGVIAAELAYLQKPLTDEALTRRVREVLDAK